MRQKTLHENATLTDRQEYLYIEHAIIEQQDSSVCIIQGTAKTPIPIASIGCLILGPGTMITHRTIEAMADSGCLLIWSGEHLRTWYAAGTQSDRSSQHIQTQARCWADKTAHMKIVRWMYAQRFPDLDMRGLSLEQMRGMEGQRVHDLYQKYAEQYHVEWAGRVYRQDDWESQPLIQQALTTGCQLLYHVSHAAILLMGYEPALGFIHTGKCESFVYDLADLYKADFVIPQAFSGVSLGKDLEHIRYDMRIDMQQGKILKRMEKDLLAMFADYETADISGLWDGDEVAKSGLNYRNKME